MIPKLLSWFRHPWYSDGEILDWLAFALLFAVIAYLWSRVHAELA